MGRMALAILAAAISGVAMAFQGAFNAALGKRVGLLGTSVAVHVTGATLTAAVIATFLLFGRRAWPGAPDLSGIPWYAYAGGVLSVLIISGVAFAFPVTGAGLGVSTIVTAQLAAAVVLDHFALFGMERNPATGLRILGVILLVVGTRLVAR